MSDSTKPAGASSTIPTPGPIVAAALLADFAEDAQALLERIEEACDGLTLLIRSARREAGRAGVPEIPPRT